MHQTCPDRCTRRLSERPLANTPMEPWHTPAFISGSLLAALLLALALAAGSTAAGSAGVRLPTVSSCPATTTCSPCSPCSAERGPAGFLLRFLLRHRINTCRPLGCCLRRAWQGTAVGAHDSHASWLLLAFLAFLPSYDHGVSGHGEPNGCHLRTAFSICSHCGPPPLARSPASLTIFRISFSPIITDSRSSVNRPAGFLY
jgi:hypothetical protein